MLPASQGAHALCDDTTKRRYPAGDGGPPQNPGSPSRAAHHGCGLSRDVTTKSVRSVTHCEQRNRSSVSGTSPRPAATSACRSASAWWQNTGRRRRHVARQEGLIMPAWQARDGRMWRRAVTMGDHRRRPCPSARLRPGAAPRIACCAARASQQARGRGPMAQGTKRCLWP
jgi:hypothetical protein